MNINIDAHVGIVSNLSDREIQGSSAHAAALHLHVGISSWCKPHVAKRDIGQRSSSMLNEPSAPECRISAYLDKSTLPNSAPSPVRSTLLQRNAPCEISETLFGLIATTSELNHVAYGSYLG